MPLKTILAQKWSYIWMMKLCFWGITNSSPFISVTEDENGINTAGGIGHDITAVLDGDG
jgi:hypothetical protein